MKKLILGLLALSLTGCSFNPSQLENSFLRRYVGPKVVRVIKVGLFGMGGGTGFQIQYDHKKYIVTNRHVCEMFLPGNEALIQLADDTLVKKRILAISDFTDLCAIEGEDSIGALQLASGVSLGEIIYVVGHPMLWPLHVSSGEIFGQTVLNVEGHESDAYQTSANALPGNSGSPVVDSWGHVIGVLFAGDSSIFWGAVITLGDLHGFLESL